MIDIILPHLFFAALIFSFRRLLHFLSNTSPKSRHNLPIYRLSQPEKLDPGWTIDWSRWSVSISTIGLNALPKLLLARLGERGLTGLKILYDAGSGIGLLGGAAGTGGAVWAAAMVWLTVWEEASAHAGQVVVRGSGMNKLSKRALEVIAADTAERSSTGGGILQPLVGFSDGGDLEAEALCRSQA